MNFSVISDRVLYKGFFEYVLRTCEHQLYGSDEEVIIEREMLKSPDAVAMLIKNKYNDKFILCEQFRSAAADNDGFLKEVPAGIIENNDDPYNVAIRETIEETGTHPVHVETISKGLYVSAGRTNEKIHCFYIEVDQPRVQEYAGLESEDEYIKVSQHSLYELNRMVANGEIKDLKTVMMINWYNFNYV